MRVDRLVGVAVAVAVAVNNNHPLPAQMLHSQRETPQILQIFADILLLPRLLNIKRKVLSLSRVQGAHQNISARIFSLFTGDKIISNIGAQHILISRNNPPALLPVQAKNFGVQHLFRVRDLRKRLRVARVVEVIHRRKEVRQERVQAGAVVVIHSGLLNRVRHVLRRLRLGSRNEAPLTFECRINQRPGGRPQGTELIVLLRGFQAHKFLVTLLIGLGLQACPVEQLSAPAKRYRDEGGAGEHASSYKLGARNHRPHERSLLVVSGSAVSGSTKVIRHVALPSPSSNYFLG